MSISNEKDIRVDILNSFMTCPHRDTNELKKIHSEMREKDPIFYSHLASWYKKNGDLRDHNEVFTSMLLTDPFLENREAGIALFQQQAIFMKSKIIGFIKGKKIVIREKTGKKIKLGKKTVDEIKNNNKVVGIIKNIPNSLKTEISNYLKWLEIDNNRFDSIALKNFKDLKHLYVSIQLKPSKRAQAILFDEKIPEDSKLSIFKKIINAETSEKSASLIVEHKIPYQIAIGLVEKITPSVLVAFINNMTAQEIITNIASLQEKGAMDNPDIKKIITEKLEHAKTAKNVTALKSKRAKETNRVKDETVLKQLDEIADKQIKKSGTIKIPTGILIDRSGSMDEAIKIGKQIASTISGTMEADLFVVAFDTMAQEIKVKNPTLTAWEEAFKPIRAGGGTSIGCGLDFLLRYNRYVEQLIIVTDEGENQQPKFVDVFDNYIKKMNIIPHIIIVRVGSISPQLSNDLKRQSIDFDIYELKNNDYYSLPGLIPLLTRKSKLDLVYEIMDFPIPKIKKYV
ncbi:MAG: VWA domain-containing protein [Candidatus Nanoarchaeia archaeon]|jgi:hypothetical protein|nr:VWA domain-containing protein [Candidatus Nanoarchaeia archaeon]